MSGIAAVLNLDGSPVPPAEIERLANVLRPHGPDRQKVLRQGNAAFVACLRHVTPEDLFERQPVVIDERHVLLFDGRLDNREELADALGIAPGDLRALPDSAVVARLFERRGDQAFERLLGDFAIIVADRQAGHLICARDHMGLRVLHYHRSSEHFAVATCPEALFALSWVPRRLNADKVADTLVHRGLNGETTYYRDIHRVLPGCLLRVRGASVSKARYWDPEAIPDIRLGSDRAYVEAFRERLDAAVRARLRSRRPPCAMITGGLDSSSISVIAADMLAAEGVTLDTYTAVPEAGFEKAEIRGRYFDERPYVRRIAELNGNISARFVPPSQGPILEKIAEQVRVGGAPSGGILNGLWVMDIAAEARAAGHEVMLSGDMGNLTMSYHGWWLFAELARTGRWWRLFQEIRASEHRWKNMLRTYTLSPFVPAPIYRRYKAWRRGARPPWHYYSAIRREFAARSGIEERAAREDFAFDAPPPRDGRLARIQSFASYSETADWFAKLRAAYGIDTRPPAFDRRLVEFCVGIPEDQYLHKGCDRWLIRRAMAGRLPTDVLASRSRGAQAADWFPRLTRERARLAAEVKRLAESEAVASLVDLRHLSAILDDWPEREPPVFGWHAEPYRVSLPQALAAACFIEDVTGANYGPGAAPPEAAAMAGVGVAGA